MPQIFLQVQMSGLIHTSTLAQTLSKGRCIGPGAFGGLLCPDFDHSTLLLISTVSELKFPLIPEQPHLNSPEQAQISKIKIPREIENVKARTHSHFRYFQGRNTNSEFPICYSNGSLRQIEMRPWLPIFLHSEQNAPCFPNRTHSTKSISEWTGTRAEA